MSIQVVNLIRYIGNGVTQPILATLSDNGIEFDAVIKVIDNPEGTLTLINEYIAYCIGVIVNLDMPDCGIATLDESSQGLDKFKIGKSSFGKCFYSRLIPDVETPNANVMKYVSNKEMMLRIIIFDHLIYNKDRNKGNLLVSMDSKSSKLYAIDHSHVFKNEAIWDASCFKQGIEYDDYLDTEILRSNMFHYSNFFENYKITISKPELFIKK